MFRPVIFGIILGAAVALGGCESPGAGLATLQDPKYPIGPQSKIAFPQDPASLPDLTQRLEGEFLQEQMRARGLNLVSAADADFILNFNATVQDVPETYTSNVPTTIYSMGTIGGRPLSGTFFSETPVEQTRLVSTAQLDVTLTTVRDPKLIVWQGRIVAPSDLEQKFRTQFYGALLDHLGQTYSGKVPLDTPDTAK